MQHIVVGVDGSVHAERALRWAITEARLTSASVELLHSYVVHAHAGMLVHDQRAPAKAALDAIVERNRSLLDGVEWSITVAPVLASPAAALVDPATRADLVVVGSRGLGGFNELLLGSTSYRTAAHAAVPVAVVPAGAGGEAVDGRRAVVVGVDDSPNAQRALRWAFDEAQRRDVTLMVVHVYPWPPEWTLEAGTSPEHLDDYQSEVHDRAVEVVDRLVDQLEVSATADVERVVLAGPPAGVLLGQAGSERLLVMGTHGRGALGRTLFGSVSHQCLHHANGPVVVVP